MVKILFVCHGNICRSPMAEFIMKELVRERGLGDRFVIASAATSDEEIWNGVGNPMYPPAREELARHKIPFEERHAAQLKKADYKEWDMFIGMDSQNIRNMKRIFGSDSDEKISKLMDYTDRPGDVSDPWYSRRFDVAYDDIYEGCIGLLEHLVYREGK